MPWLIFLSKNCVIVEVCSVAAISLVLKLLDATSEDSWTRKFFSAAKENGFEQTIYGLVPNKKTPLENAFIRSNYSASWRRIYDAERLHYVDPTVTHCQQNLLPLVWERETFNLPAQKNLYEEACGYGIRSGITYPIHGPNGEFGVISFATDAPSNHKFRNELNHSLASLSLIRDSAFESSQKFIRKHAKNEDKQICLTRRELECLKWLMVGKSSWEISMILHCSEAVVNFHVSNIRLKFKVRTRQQAVIKAIRLGILAPA